MAYAKCYFVQGQNKVGKKIYNCKGVAKKHNDLHFERYKDVLDVFPKAAIASELEGIDIDKAKNVGFRVYDEVMVASPLIKISAMCYLMVLIQGPESAHAEPQTILNTYKYFPTNLDTFHKISKRSPS